MIAFFYSLCTERDVKSIRALSLTSRVFRDILHDHEDLWEPMREEKLLIFQQEKERAALIQLEAQRALFDFDSADSQEV